jgi:hypothetical protein
LKITPWYGVHQVFGRLGNPQRLINLPGSVDCPAEVVWIRYRLNNSPQVDFCIGPDQRRLINPGDFNIEIETGRLWEGVNEVVIDVLDTAGKLTRQNLTIDYSSGPSWPLPYTIRWQEVKNLQEVAQVIDGRWEIKDGRLHCIEAGYDRLVAIGDHLAWQDYEVTVPITVHAVSPTGMRFPSLGDWAGIVLRWQGHYDWSTDQPLRGWYPLGAICSYFWNYQQQQRRLSLLGNNVKPIAVDSPERVLHVGITYWFRARVQSQIGKPAWYSLKVWEDGSAEPVGWQLEGQGILGELSCGSVLLAAHQCEASFGDIVILPLVKE